MRPIADGVMAATHKLVQQAMSGQWHDVPKTVEQRRELLDQLNATASLNDQPWLNALKDAMAESDAVVAKIAKAGAPAESSVAAAGAGALPGDAILQDLAQPGSTLEWLKRSR